MQLTNGRRIDRRHKDSYGSEAYVFWVDNQFDPPTTLVRGDSLDDAYSWFICDESFEKNNGFFENYRKADGTTDWEYLMRDYPTVLEPTEVAVWAAYCRDELGGVECNDNGTLVYTEAVMGQALKDYMGAER